MDTATSGRSGQARQHDTDGVVIREKQPRGNRKKDRDAYLGLQRELVTKLNHLRAETRAASEAYAANVDSDVSTLIEFLNGSSEVRKPRDLKAATMEEWMRILDNVSVKPHKGRRKDLRRIDRAVRAMMQSAFE
jgi:hypothetical protein